MGRPRRFSGLALGLLAALWLCACSARDQAHTRELIAMDTVMTFTAYGPRGEAAIDAVIAEMERLDALLSTGGAASEVSRLNREGGGAASADTQALLRASLEVYAATDGLFDFTIYPLMELWGFPTGAYRVPSQEEIDGLLPLVDASRVRLEEGRVVLGEGQQLDFGGIAKGYASARAMEIFRERGVTSAMVSLGGNIQTLGRKPDGSAWRIGVQDPEAPQGTVLAVLEACGQAVITSGGYQRYFEEGGRRYIHILDPRTGRPAESDLLSATVVSEDAVWADALSTALYILGREGAEALWRESGGAFDMVLVGGDGALFVTEGVRLQTEKPVTVLALNEA